MSQLSRRDFRVVILYNFKRGLSAEECLNEMISVFEDSCPSRSTVFRWYKQFQRGIFALDDDPHTGRPVEITTPENIASVQNLLKENRRITYRQIEEVLHINAPAVHSILHEHLNVRKVCTLWVPHKLTDAQMRLRVDWCRKMLTEYEMGSSNYVNSIVTGDETWLYYFDLPSKSRNKIWLFEDEQTRTMVKQSRSVKKKMIVVFFGRRGIISRFILAEQKTVTAKWYIDFCLTPLVQILKNLRPRSRLDTWRFHHDNAPPHKAAITQEFLTKSGLTIIEHPPYSPDLAPCDFGLFPFVKDKLKGRHFKSDEELIAAWDEACAEIPNHKWEDIFNDWFLRMQKCIEHDGKYFEKI